MEWQARVTQERPSFIYGKKILIELEKQPLNSRARSSNKNIMSYFMLSPGMRILVRTVTLLAIIQPFINSRETHTGGGTEEPGVKSGWHGLRKGRDAAGRGPKRPERVSPRVGAALRCGERINSKK